jgi:tetratricopeptide (TPR) repeat protein
MLSWHEGFGLAGWEAIGAGIPLIVSRNSGVYRLLDSIGGAAVGCVRPLDVLGRGDGVPNDVDIQATKKLIVEAASDIPKAQANAESLRILLRFQRAYTWDSTAAVLAHSLGIPTVASMLRDGSPIAEIYLGEPPEVMEGLDVAAAERILSLAQTYYHNGQYEEALTTLESLKKNDGRRKVPVSTAIDATLTECDVLLRLNQYAKAKALVASASREASDREDWRRYIRARSIENVILRDLGKYDEAVALAQELLHLAKRWCPDELETAHRKVGRSLALAGRWDEAIKHGEEARARARERRDGEGEAKALLVIGEGRRHGLNQAEAVKAYTLGRDLSGRAGNVDCYLWCVLGLADSIFLLGQRDEAHKLLRAIHTYIAGSSQRYPLESLHLTLSLLTVRKAAGESVDEDLENVLEQYRELGVQWPVAYVDEIRAGDYSHPKRF